MAKQRFIVSLTSVICCTALLFPSTTVAESGRSIKSVKPDDIDAESIRRQEETIQELQQQITKAQKEIDRLQKEKETMMENTRELGKDAASWNTKLSQCRSEEARLRDSETTLRREMGHMVQDVSRLRRESQRNEKAIGVCKTDLESVRKEQKQQARPDKDEDCTCSVSKAALEEKLREMEKVAEKIEQCERTVKIARETCDNDQLEIKSTQKELEKLQKTTTNCSSQLTECDSQKGHLEFLKKGYELVVPSLETEFQEAKQAKEKSEKKAARAVQGAAKYYTYLVIIFLLSAIGGTVKLYYIAGETLKRRTAAIIDAKVKEKLENKKNKRK